MKQRIIIRLDDAAERMDIDKWQRMEDLLDEYNIKPLVGVIPDCQDPMMKKYKKDDRFWDKVHKWEDKGWNIAMHGYRHVYDSNDGGINPVNKFSEFAGHPLEVQRERIRAGIYIFRKHGLEPKIFFAPGHTFDSNTLLALKAESNIRIISDTIAWDVYSKDGFTFVPQQSGRVRKLPFRTETFCYHPNVMKEDLFVELYSFIKIHIDLFINQDQLYLDSERIKEKNILDSMLQYIYIVKRYINEKRKI